MRIRYNEVCLYILHCFRVFFFSIVWIYVMTWWEREDGQIKKRKLLKKERCRERERGCDWYGQTETDSQKYFEGRIGREREIGWERDEGDGDKRERKKRRECKEWIMRLGFHRLDVVAGKISVTDCTLPNDTHHKCPEFIVNITHVDVLTKPVCTLSIRDNLSLAIVTWEMYVTVLMLLVVFCQDSNLPGDKWKPDATWTHYQHPLQRWQTQLWRQDTGRPLLVR